MAFWELELVLSISSAEKFFFSCSFFFGGGGGGEGPQGLSQEPSYLSFGSFLKSYFLERQKLP